MFKPGIYIYLKKSLDQIFINFDSQITKNIAREYIQKPNLNQIHLLYSTTKNVKNRAVKEAKIKHIKIYDFMYSHVSLLINNGMILE